MTPELGDVVIYRHPGHGPKEPAYDVPAIVTATSDTIRDVYVTAGRIRPLSGAEYVHLTVLSADTSVAFGAERARDVPFEAPDDGEPTAGTWYFKQPPMLVGVPEMVVDQQFDIPVLTAAVTRELSVLLSRSVAPTPGWSTAGAIS